MLFNSPSIQTDLKLPMTSFGNSFGATYSSDPIAEAFFPLIVANDTAGLGNMLAKGFGVDTRNDVGNTPLIFALVQMKPDVALYLMAAGADVNLEGAKGSVAVMLAARLGCDDVAAAMIDRGANPTAKNRSSECALDFAGLKTLAAAWPKLDTAQQDFWFLNMLSNGKIAQVQQLIEVEKFKLLRLDRQTLNKAMAIARADGFSDIADYTVSKLSIEVAVDATHGLRQRVQLQRPILLKPKP